MATRRTKKQVRYDKANAIEAKLRKAQRLLNGLIDEAREAGVPIAVVSKVQDAWMASMSAQGAVSRVACDILLDYSDSAVERRADIYVSGLNDSRMVDDIHADMARIPKDCEVGQYVGGDPYIQNMFAKRCIKALDKL